MSEMMSESSAGMSARSWLSEVEAARWLDVPVWSVQRWCEAGLVPGARHGAAGWRLPRRGLLFFCGRTVEPMYSPESVAAILELSVETVRGYLSAGRLRSVKLGAARCAPVRVAESELRRFARA